MLDQRMEREENALEDDLANGLISQHEYNQAMRDLQREYREYAHEAALDAYHAELDRW